MQIVHVTTSDADYRGVFELRDEVLRKPLGMSLANDDLSRDETDVILAGKVGAEVVVCLMLHRLNDNEVQLRQMAVSPHLQGQGYGKKLVAYAEEYARLNGYSTMVLHARQVAVGFYKSMGYTAFGNEFEEVGIPHVMMSKQLL